MNISAADVLVTTPAIYKRKIAKIRDELTSVKHVLLVEIQPKPGHAEFSSLMDEASEDAPIEPTTAEDPSLLHFTSGTTGTPRGAQHARRRGHALQHWPAALDLHPDDIYWCTADPGWVTGTSRASSPPAARGHPRSSTRPSSTRRAGTRYWDEGSQRLVHGPDGHPDADQRRTGKPRRSTDSCTFLASLPASANRSTPKLCGGQRLLGFANSRQLVADGDRRHHGVTLPAFDIKPG